MIARRYILAALMIGLVASHDTAFGMQAAAPDNDVIAPHPLPQPDNPPRLVNPPLADAAGSEASGFTAYSEVASLLAALLQAPYIATVDSTNPKTIKFCASMSAAATSLKVASIAAGHGQTMIVACWHVPKMLAFLLSIGYDTIRVLDAPKVAYKNHTDNKKLSGFKLNQSMLLGVEIALRSMAIWSHDEKDLALFTVSGTASEVADAVSIWRLLSRYITYFYYTDKVEFTFSMQKKQDPIPTGLDDTENEHVMIDELEKELTILSENLILQDQQNNTSDALTSA